MFVIFREVILKKQLSILFLTLICSPVVNYFSIVLTRTWAQGYSYSHTFTKHSYHIPFPATSILYFIRCFPPTYLQQPTPPSSNSSLRAMLIYHLLSTTEKEKYNIREPKVEDDPLASATQKPWPPPTHLPSPPTPDIFFLVLSLVQN